MNLLHLDHDVASVALEGLGTRLSFVSDSGFVLWPGAKALLAQADRAMHADKVDGIVHDLIVGPPLSGASSLLREIERRGTLVPSVARKAVVIDAPHKFESIRVTHVLSRALDAVGGPARGSLQSESKALRSIRDASTRLILVRKIDRLPDREKSKLALYMQAFCEAANCSLIMTGSRRERKLLIAHPELQVRTRIHEFSPWPQERWVVDVVEAAIRRYPLRRPSPVTPELMVTLFGRTRGHAGRIFGLLKAAAREAIASKTETIDPPLLRRAEAPFSDTYEVRSRSDSGYVND